MTTFSQHFEARYEFSPAIVWDALVDPDLVSGWLGEAAIGPELGGQYRFRPVAGGRGGSWEGRVTRFEPFAYLEATTRDGESLLFCLSEAAGGSRGTSTAVTLDIMLPVEPASAAMMAADWTTNLDQLANLLRGHPVDWWNGKRDQVATWLG